MFLLNWFQESVMGETLMVLFLVAFVGYLVGSITIKGVELGTAGVLLVALVFGHFLGSDEALVEGLGMFQDLGLICFVTSVGFIAGPKFFRNFKINAKSYILLGFIIIAIGALVTAGIIEIAGVPTDITVRSTDKYSGTCSRAGCYRLCECINRIWYCLSVRSCRRRAVRTACAEAS